MNNWSSAEAQPAIFSRLLAELVNRLRLSRAQHIHHDLSWPICSRLGVQADLLGGLAKESGLKDLAHLSQTLAELAVLGRDDPNHIPRAWSGALTRLANFLDKMMVGLDNGDVLDQWLADAQWERLTSWFNNLETPLLVMDELEETLLRWQNLWCGDSLDPAHEAELQERWVRLREFGDALFSSSHHESGAGLLRWKGFTP